LQQNLYLYL